ncbi:HEAT repeat domain-containing protein [Altererythrobacter sp.]|uniref:HEAT repeat domain-containing protein n=1 Tax=Altererythrobacter sp. TaxID=1872480 RepID=UPI003D041AA4
MNLATSIDLPLTEALPRPLAERLDDGVAERLVPVYADLRDEIVAFADERAAPMPARRHAEIVARFCNRQSATIAALGKAEALFQSRFTSAADEAEERAAILDFARALGADSRQLKRDAKALEKFFDADAVLERFHKRMGERERALAYALERLGPVAGDALSEDPGMIESAFFIDLFEDLLAGMRNWRGDPRVRRAAHMCMGRIARRISRWPGGVWFDTMLSATRRVCLDESEDLWTQCAALDALLALSPTSIPSVMRRRLSVSMSAKTPQQRDNELFVRRHMVRMLCANLGRIAKLKPVLATLANDPDGAVRQAFADSLHELPEEHARGMLTRMRTDKDPQVRAAIFADPARLLGRVDPATYVLHIRRILTYDTDEFVLRIAMDAAAATVSWCLFREHAALDEVVRSMREGIALFRRRALSPKLLRWADEARERIWLMSDPEALEIAGLIRATTEGQREAQIKRVRGLRPHIKADREKVGRVMAVLAQRDFGLSLETGLRPSIQRGEWLRRRWWRIMFEGRNSATDKRQAFHHTTGRHYWGSMIAPSARMAELAPTKVPGEPLFESKEGGWRNYLPLLDQVLSALDRGGTIELYTSAGITEIEAPSGLWRRMRAFWRVSRDFVRLAGLRNREPGEYLAELRKLGLTITFRSYGEVEEPNPEVVKLFSMGGILPALPMLWDKAFAYATTVYENSLVELAVFLGLASLWFFGRHIALGFYARRLRNSLALSLGGWGTRGKSGTERLKAGLINALGPSIVSKTTGCEAMFLIGNPFGGLTEMFLFRPYDKATIWEQFNLLRTAKGLSTRVFLWECMGLNPAYVRVLQQDWMRDDIGTLTNTYPDHEDVQGPAGRNIPEVMCEFIPHNSVCLTTEEEMLPILMEGGEKANTRMRAVTWKEAGLIHKSLLERFPYEEHPYNIALVTAMGDELGLEPDYCVREMADRVVADLGVLKTYPRSEINGRTLEFVMGMSANERFGAMGNWTRMGFIDHDLANDPEIFVTTVVNNRADRVPRSRVFARMLVHDVSADKHFLIGSNIEGLTGFIDEEWAAYAAGLTLFEDGVDPRERLAELAKKQRIPLSQAELDGLLGAMLAPQSEKIARDRAITAAQEGKLAAALEQAGVAGREAILAHYEAMANFHRDYAALESSLGGGKDSVDRQMRELLGRAFRAKLVPVRDFYIKGEMIVRLVAEQTPPGLINRIMGMQNIKGTGLDWVYRWQAWETVWKACQQLRDDDPVAIERGFRMLASFQEYGALSEKEVRSAVAALRERIEQVPAIAPAQLDALEVRLTAQLRKFEATESEVDSAEEQEMGRFAAAGERLISITEDFLDAGDAVRRRRASDRIYKALIAEQVSLQRAASELKALTSRQKGGWLGKSLKERSRRLLESRKAA